MPVLTRTPETIQEKLIWLTNIMRARDGTETRLNVRADPRIALTLGYPSLVERDRTLYNRLLNEMYQGYTDVPLWQYATRVTAPAAISDSDIYYDFHMSPITVGEKIAFLDRGFGYVGFGVVGAAFDTFVSLEAPLDITIKSDYHVCPMVSMLISDMSKVRIDGIISEGDISLEAYSGYEIEIDSPYVLTTYDGFPVLDKRPIEGVESNSILREIMDFGTGQVDAFLHGEHLDIMYERTYRFNRYTTDEMKFWRKFFNFIRGSWKPFLTASWMPDFTVETLAQNGNTFTAEIGEYTDFPTAIEAYRRIQVEYADGSVSYHKITGYTDIVGGRRFNITPNLPNDAKVPNFRKISRLLKAYLGDTVEINHGHLYSEIKVTMNSTDFG